MGDCWSRLLGSTATRTECCLPDGLAAIRADGHAYTPFHLFVFARINKYAYKRVYKKGKALHETGTIFINSL